VPAHSDPEKKLVDTEHYCIQLHSASNVVVVTRKPKPFESREDTDRACTPVQTALDKLGRAKFALVLDSRRAVGRNDADYESWFAPHRVRMVAGFRRVAIVVATPVGNLHVNRLLREDQITNVVVVSDMAAALTYAMATPKKT
jgi:hypothetical protein